MVFLKGQFLVHCTFLIYINDLNQALKFCKVHHFADDTNLIHFSKSVNRLNKHVNLDLKNLTYWLNANKIALNVKKTELVIFKHQRKKLDSPIKSNSTVKGSTLLNWLNILPPKLMEAEIGNKTFMTLQWNEIEPMPYYIQLEILLIDIF